MYRDGCSDRHGGNRDLSQQCELNIPGAPLRSTHLRTLRTWYRPNRGAMNAKNMLAILRVVSPNVQLGAREVTSLAVWYTVEVHAVSQGQRRSLSKAGAICRYKLRKSHALAQASYRNVTLLQG